MENVADVIMDTTKPTPIVDCNEVLIKLIAANNEGQVSNFNVDTNNAQGITVATFWIKKDTTKK